MFRPIIVGSTFLLLLMSCHIICDTWTRYKIKDVNASQLCSRDNVELEFLAENLLICLTKCSSSTACGSSFYHRNSTACYHMKPKHKDNNCTMGSAWTNHFIKQEQEDDTCFDGWECIGSSCYWVTSIPGFHPDTEAVCKRCNTRAHLADIQTAEELEHLKTWLMVDTPFETLWLGGTLNGSRIWVWSDGSHVEGCNWARVDHSYNTSVLYCMHSDGKFKWKYKECTSGSRHHHKLKRGLCELDVFKP